MSYKQQSKTTVPLILVEKGNNAKRGKWIPHTQTMHQSKSTVCFIYCYAAIQRQEPAWFLAALALIPSRPNLLFHPKKIPEPKKPVLSVTSHPITSIITMHIKQWEQQIDDLLKKIGRMTHHNLNCYLLFRTYMHLPW